MRPPRIGQEAAESVSKRRHVMQVVNDDDSRRRAPAAGPGSDVIVGRRACALLDDVRQVLSQFTRRLLVNGKRCYHSRLQFRLSISASNNLVILGRVVCCHLVSHVAVLGFYLMSLLCTNCPHLPTTPPPVVAAWRSGSVT